MTTRDIPGVIAPPPLIYLGFLFLGWGLAQLGAQPGAVEAGFGWLSAGYGLTVEARRAVALILIVGGLLFDGMAAGLFRRRGTAVEPWKPSTALIVEGPYRFTRNPMYLGMVMLLIGVAVMLGTLTPGLVIPPFAWWISRRFIAQEEVMLEERFGEEYLQFMRRVRRWI